MENLLPSYFCSSSFTLQPNYRKSNFSFSLVLVSDNGYLDFVLGLDYFLFIYRKQTSIALKQRDRICLNNMKCQFRYSVFSSTFAFVLSHVFFSGSRALFMGLTCTFFSQNNFKIRFYGTIHTFKNYFVTMFSAFIFQ